MSPTAPCPDEDALAAHVAGTLGGHEAASLEEHLDTCASCYHLLATYARAYSRDDAADAISRSHANEKLVAKLQGARALAPGAILGRYVILEWVGEGGSGLVYAAYDPKLDRKVALKLLQPTATREPVQRERLFQEARAMAKLAHPHVVAVHDVGTFEDHIFIAMEFVEGATLRAWLRAKIRTPKEIVAAFVDAGRGLAAAHAAGLVHRDFKPENVLIGKDGRARVTDFGLACLPYEVAEGESGPTAGTPAYMSPEQKRGRTADARSDQYSFSVALSEALPATQVRVRRILRRALSEAPGERYPSFDELLAKLGKERLAPWRRALYVTAALVTAGSIAFSVRQWRAQSAQMCHGGDQKLDAVWNEGTKKLVSERFLATDKPYAADALRGAVTTLDAYAASWLAMSVDACETTRVRGEQSEELLDLRMVCLDDRLKEMSALTDVLTHADGVVVSNALAASQSLTRLSHCADLKALTARVKPPNDPVIAGKVAEIESELAELKVLQAAGKYADGRDRAAKATLAARLTGYRPVTAEALFRYAELRGLAGDRAGATSTLYEAAFAADASGDDHLRALVWCDLLFYEGYINRKYAEAPVYRDQGLAAIDRQGGDDEAKAELSHAFGAVLGSAGRMAEAQRAQEESLALKEKLYGPDSRQVGFSLSNLGVTLMWEGLLDESIRRQRRAVSLSEHELGLQHPRLTFLYENFGVALRLHLDLAEAETVINRGLALGESGLGPEHPIVGSLLADLGDILCDKGEYARAAAPYERALRLHEKAGDDEGIAYDVGALGKSYVGTSDFLRALPFLERSVTLRKRDSELAESQFILARALTGLGRDRSRAHALAVTARDTFLTIGKTPLDAVTLKTIEAWLETHPKP